MADTKFKPGFTPWNKGLKGIHLSPSTEFKKGMSPVNKKPKIEKTCKCGKIFYVRPSLVRVVSCSRKCSRVGIPSPMVGKRMSQEARLKMRLAKLGKCGPSHWNYRGYKGRTERKIEMSRDRYILWRKFIFELDNYTCQKCFKRGVYLEADHKRSWRNFPEERYMFSNGQTLCRPCHRTTINFGAKTRSNDAV